MKIRTKTTIRTLVMSTIFLLASVMAIAQTSTVAPGGNWNDATKWSAGVPTATIVANVNHPMTLTSTPTTVTTGTWNVGNTAGGVIIDPAGGTAYGMSMTGAGTLNFVSGSSNFEGTVAISAGTLNVRNGATLTIGTLTVTGTGKVVVDAGGILIVNSNLVDGTLAATTNVWTINGYMQVNGNFSFTNAPSVAKVIPTTATTGQLLATGSISSGGGAGTIFGTANDIIAGGTFSSARTLIGGLASGVAHSVKINNYPTFAMTDCYFPPMSLSVTNASTGAAITSTFQRWEESSTSAGTGFTTIVGATATYTPPATVGTKWYRCVYKIGASVDLFSYPVRLTVNATNTRTWTGNTNTDWNTTSNWQENAVPDLFSNVTIPATANSPQLPLADVDIRSLTVDATATVNLHTSGNLEVHCGSIVNNGSIVSGTTSAVGFYGGTQSYTGTNTTWKEIFASYSNLTWDADASLEKYLILGQSTTFDPDGPSNNRIFNLMSYDDRPADVSAYVLAIPSGSSITGKVRWWRYFDAYRYPGYAAFTYNNYTYYPQSGSWYGYTSMPLSNIPISDMQGEVFVSGSFTGQTYPTNCSPSCSGGQHFYTYNEPAYSYQQWSTTDNNVIIPTLKGSSFWHLGHAYQDNDITWKLDGVPLQGDIVIPATVTPANPTNGWYTGALMLPNPYTSAIDLRKVNFNIPSSGFTGVFYYPHYKTSSDYWNPNQSIFNITTGASTGGGTPYLAPGQAIWTHVEVPADTTQSVNTSVTITENAKIAKGENTTWVDELGDSYPLMMANANKNAMYAVPPPAPTIPYMYLALKGVGNSNKDDVFIGFHANGTKAYNRKLDAVKNINMSEGRFALGIKRGSRTYAHDVHSLDSIIGTTLDVLVANKPDSSYTLNWVNGNFDAGVRIRLYDEQTSTYTDMKTNSSYAYTGAANDVNGRFQVIFDELYPPLNASSHYTCGFECETHNNSYGHWNASGSGVAPTVVNSERRSASRSVKIAPSSQTSYFNSNRSFTGGKYAMRFYVKFTTLPNVSTNIAEFNGAGAVRFNSSDSKLYANASGSNGSTGVAITTNTWYRIDLGANFQANNHVVYLQVDGTSAGNAVYTFDASVPTTYPRLGNSTSATMTAYYDDFIVTSSINDYPLGAGYVHVLIPTADGTHNVAGANDFERSLGGVDIINTTTDAYALVNAWPQPGFGSSPANFINMVAPVSITDYVEVKFGLPSCIPTPNKAPRALEFIYGWKRPDSNVASSFAQLNDNGVIADMDGDFSGGTGNTTVSHKIRSQKLPWNTNVTRWKIGTGTDGDILNLKMRFRSGHLGNFDVTPDTHFTGAVIEMEFPGTAPSHGVSCTN